MGHEQQALRPICGQSEANVATTAASTIAASPKPALHRSKLSRRAKRPIRLSRRTTASTKPATGKTIIWVQARHRCVDDDESAIQHEQSDVDESNANEQCTDVIVADGNDEVTTDDDARRRRHADGHESAEESTDE